MKIFLRVIIPIACIVIFGLCLWCWYLGSFSEGKFKAEPFSIYFLAKGIFCSLILLVVSLILRNKMNK